MQLQIEFEGGNASNSNRARLWWSWCISPLLLSTILVDFKLILKLELRESKLPTPRTEEGGGTQNQQMGPVFTCCHWKHKYVSKKMERTCKCVCTLCCLQIFIKKKLCPVHKKGRKASNFATKFSCYASSTQAFVCVFSFSIFQNLILHFLTRAKTWEPNHHTLTSHDCNIIYVNIAR